MKTFYKSIYLLLALIVLANLSEIRAQSFAAREYNSFSICGDGSVMAWGVNATGQLGNGSTSNSNVPVPVSSLNNVISIAAGQSHAIALKADGTVWTWGNNFSGQLGIGSSKKSLVPVQVSGLTNIKAVAAGFE